jgi:uncharacterized protein
MGESTNVRTLVSPRETVGRIHRLMLNDDVSAQADLYAPNGVLEWPLAPPGVPRRLQGRERIRRELMMLDQRAKQAGTSVVGLSAVIHETVDYEVVIVELEVRAELNTTGLIYRHPYIQVFRIRDGEIVLCRDYFTRVEIAGITSPWH